MRWCFVVVLAWCALGCGKRGPLLKLTDTEGRTLVARCNPKDHRCRLKQKSGPTWPDDQPKLVFHTTGYLIALCNVAEETTPPSPRDCRALVCEQDAQCPPEAGGLKGRCLNGLCTEPTGDLTPDDSVVLCLAGRGLGAGTPAQIEAYALGLNCGKPCTVPKTCRQP